MRKLVSLVAALSLLLALMATPALAQEPEEAMDAECNGESVTVTFRGRGNSPVGFIDGRPIIALQFGGDFTVTDLETGESFEVVFEEERERGRGIRDDRLQTCVFETAEEFVAEPEDEELGLTPGREYRVEGSFWVLAFRPSQQGAAHRR